MTDRETTDLGGYGLPPGVTRERASAAVEKADEAFWAAIAEAFPEVTHGDWPPDCSFDRERDNSRALAQWLMWNHPANEG